MIGEHDIGLPPFPQISDSILDQCRRNSDFSPILFEWYKAVGILCHSICSINRKSPIWKREPEKIQYGILIGMINRCRKLIHSNMILSCEGMNGEATSIIDRCIFETSVKIQWLCRDSDSDKFERYLAEGLKSDIVAKNDIMANIRNKGFQSNIEKRMLGSIEKRIAQSGMTEEKIVATKKLQDLSTMIHEIGLPRTVYVFGQKMGSHNVHGNWSALLWFYVKCSRENEYSPKFTSAPTSQDQFVGIIFDVLSALKCYIKCHGIKYEEMERGLDEYFDTISREVGSLYSALVETEIQDSNT